MTADRDSLRCLNDFGVPGVPEGDKRAEDSKNCLFGGLAMVVWSGKAAAEAVGAIADTSLSFLPTDFIVEPEEVSSLFSMDLSRRRFLEMQKEFSPCVSGDVNSLVIS